jgi:hypothetical protein
MLVASVRPDVTQKNQRPYVSSANSMDRPARMNRLRDPGSVVCLQRQVVARFVEGPSLALLEQYQELELKNTMLYRMAQPFSNVRWDYRTSITVNISA